MSIFARCWLCARLWLAAAVLLAASGAVAKEKVLRTTWGGCHADEAVSFASGVRLSGAEVLKKQTDQTVRRIDPNRTEIHWKCKNGKNTNQCPIGSDRLAARRVGGRVRMDCISSTGTNVRVTGKLMTRDPDTGTSDFRDCKNGDWNIIPLKRVHVKLMDHNWGKPDEVLAEGYTRDDGSFDLSGLGGGDGKPDVYVMFLLQDFKDFERIDVKDSADFTQKLRSKIHYATTGTIDLGTINYFECEASIFAKAQRAYDKFTRLTGRQRLPGSNGLLGVEYPAMVATMYTQYSSIRFPFHPDRQDWFELEHEFGHRIRHGACGDAAHFSADLMRFVYARSHDGTELTHPGYSFNEGWAEYNNVIFRQDPIAPANLFPSNYGLANRYFGTNYKSPYGTGIEFDVENDVTRKLLHLSQECGGYTRMLETLLDNPSSYHGLVSTAGNGIHSFPQFVAALKRKHPDCKYVNHREDEPGAKPLAGKATLIPPRQPKLPSQALHAHLAAFHARPAPARGAAPLIAPQISKTDQQALARLFKEREQHLKQWDQSARAAYGRLLSSARPPTEASIKDGSYQRSLEAARAAFVKALAEPQLRYAQQMLREAQAAKAKASHPDAAEHLQKVIDGYRRLESELKAALAAKPGARLPESLLPLTFAKEAAR